MTNSGCSIENCTSPTFARGWCSKHWTRWRRHGDPQSLAARVVDPFERMCKYIDPTGFCWEWNGVLANNGYGALKINGRHYQAHRWVYECLVGPIPAGMEMDHLCRVRKCVNPDHLEPVTHAENAKRGLSGRLRPAGASRSAQYRRAIRGDR